MLYKIKSKTIVFFLVLSLIVGCSESSAIQPKKSGYAQVEEGALFYEQFGNGTPMLVLHGGPGLDHTYLLPQMLALAKDHEVTFYDQRGAGKSLDTPINASYINLDQFTKDVDAIRRAIGHDKLIIVGHSFGGKLAMNYALNYPEHVSQLILFNSGPADHKGQQAFLDELMLRTKPLGDKLAALSNETLFDSLSADSIHTLFRELFSVYFYQPDRVKELTLSMSAESAKSGFRVRAMMPPDSSEFNLISRLHSLQVPTLIIHGSADVVPLSTAHDLNRAIENSKLHIIEDCGHFPYIEKPDEFFSAIRHFEASTRMQ